MRKFQYIEPDENGETVVNTVTEEEIYAWWDNNAKKKFSPQIIERFNRDFGGIENYPNEEKILDFISVHWAWEVFDD